MPPAERGALVVATTNHGKLREYRELLAGLGFEIVGLKTGVEETGETYEANAILKAEAARDLTGLPALGDDAGIEVDALDGYPGIVSARIGPTQVERTRRLLDRLTSHPRPWRAKFVAALALASAGEQTVVVRGEREGEVVPEWRGTVGFGYDPVFLIPEDGRTFGEMESAEKHRWSHRGAAVRALMATGALDRLRTGSSALS